MIRSAVYHDDTVETVDVTDDDGDPAADDLRRVRDTEGVSWVDATAADAHELRHVAEAFGVHSLVVEDVVNNVRPKVESFEEYTFALVKEAELTRGDTPFHEEVHDEPVGLVVGDDWLCVLSTEPIAAVDAVWDAVARGDGRLLDRGADYAAYRVLDRLVDEYFEVLDRIETTIELVEEDVLVSTDIGTLERINNVRRDLLSFRKVTWPTRSALVVLARGDPEQIRPETEKYYRDVYDHLVEIVDLTETYRDLTSGARDIYLNTVSQSTNEVMKTLTVVATVFLPLTFVVGVYGMNFEGGPTNMPELRWAYGYPAVMVGMLAVAVVMLAYFRRVDYI
ncbi:magnesium/cobalt transporter CorA [Halomarina salina]|uniref:Magnesium transport protein CorA n=1 Tax=Halomarina salina TaxID=1872699 RepID=A0ABD5RHG6_9EURY